MGKKKQIKRAKVVGWFSGEVEWIEFTDLEEWLTEHGGAVIVYPPSVTGVDYWQFNTTDKTNRFNQR